MADNAVVVTFLMDRLLEVAMDETKNGLSGSSRAHALHAIEWNLARGSSMGHE